MTTSGTHRAWLGLAAAALLALLVLTLLVATGATRGLDEAAMQRYRPDDMWGPSQQRLNPFIDLLAPAHMLLLLAATCVLTALVRRSWQPFVLVAVWSSLAGVLGLSLKFALHRGDPKGQFTGTGGSYPSGHMIAIMVCSGLCLLLVLHRPHRVALWLLVCSAAALMGAALMVTAAHWLTDVVGGALIGIVVLAAASAYDATTGVPALLRRLRDRPLPEDRQARRPGAPREPGAAGSTR